MRLKVILTLAFTAVFGQFEAKAHVELLKTFSVVPGKVSIEPFTCPFAGASSGCPIQAKPRGELANWLTIYDYPSRARQANQSGAVELQLEIDRASGRSVDCRLIKSSGFELLDAESCKRLQRRARFWPQPAPKGIATPLYFNVRIVWLAPWETSM